VFVVPGWFCVTLCVKLFVYCAVRTVSRQHFPDHVPFLPFLPAFNAHLTFSVTLTTTRNPRNLPGSGSNENLRFGFGLGLRVTVRGTVTVTVKQHLCPLKPTLTTTRFPPGFPAQTKTPALG
jgi:hypothetical protein